MARHQRALPDLLARGTTRAFHEVVLSLVCVALAGLRLLRAFALPRSLDSVFVLHLTSLDLTVIVRVGRHDSTVNILQHTVPSRES